MSGPLRGGRRRRRVGPILLALLVLALPVALGAGVYLWVTADDGPGARPGVVDTMKWSRASASSVRWV